MNAKITNTDGLSREQLEDLELGEVRERAAEAARLKEDKLAAFRAGKVMLTPEEREGLVRDAEFWQAYLSNREARARQEAKNQLTGEGLALSRSLKANNREADDQLDEARREAVQAVSRYADVIESVNDERAGHKRQVRNIRERASELGLDGDAFGAANGAASHVRIPMSAFRRLAETIIEAFDGRAKKLLIEGRDQEAFRLLRYFTEHETGSLKDARLGPLD